MLLNQGADPTHLYDQKLVSTLLHLVSQNQLEGFQTRNIKFLFQYGADPEAKDEGGKSFFAGAVDESTLQVVPFFLDRGANLEPKENKGKTPPGAVVVNGQSEAAHLFHQNGADLETRNDNGHTR